MGRKPEESVTNADDEGENDRRLTTLDTKTRHRLSEVSANTAAHFRKQLLRRTRCLGECASLLAYLSLALAWSGSTRTGIACLNRLRKQARLYPSMDPHDVVMVCVRADDPLEQAVIDQSGIEIVFALERNAQIQPCLACRANAASVRSGDGRIRGAQRRPGQLCTGTSRSRLGLKSRDLLP